jgi:hypothetical protein
MPPPTEAEIALLEDLLGTQLPAAYIDFLMFSNGGCTALDVFDGGDREGEIPLDHFFHISSDVDSIEGVLWQYRHRWPGAPREMLPVADDGFGDKICIDLTKSGKGRVVVWLHERPEDPILEVAESFEEFIDSLYEFTEEE